MKSEDKFLLDNISKLLVEFSCIEKNGIDTDTSRFKDYLLSRLNFRIFIEDKCKGLFILLNPFKRNYRKTCKSAINQYDSFALKVFDKREYESLQQVKRQSKNPIEPIEYYSPSVYNSIKESLADLISPNEARFPFIDDRGHSVLSDNRSLFQDASKELQSIPFTFGFVSEQIAKVYSDFVVRYKSLQERKAASESITDLCKRLGDNARLISNCLGRMKNFNIETLELFDKKHTELYADIKKFERNWGECENVIFPSFTT